MENTTPIPTEAMKQVKMPRSIDMSRMTEEELCSDLLEALDEIERGEGIPLEEVKALYGIMEEKKQVKMPRSIDMSRITEEELCSDLLEALDAIERGDVYTEEEVKAELTRLYGTTFD